MSAEYTTREIKCGNRMLAVRVCLVCNGNDGVFHNNRTCTPFTPAIEPSPAPVQPQAEPVAEIIECSKMGQQTVKEIDGRWKFLDYGTKLYAGAAPVAQADKLDAEMFRWFMLGDRTTTDALLDLHMRQLNDDKPTLDEWRTAINAAMKGTP